MTPPARILRLRVEPLTRAAFAPFGEVIEAAAATDRYAINSGTTERFHDLARIDASREDGRPVLSIFRAQPRQLPFTVTMLERHPLGSQAFVPLSRLPYLVVVAADPAAEPRAFLARDGQGVNYHAGTWHHPLLALEAVSDFLVIDRAGPGNNCDEVELAASFTIETVRRPVDRNGRPVSVGDRVRVLSLSGDWFDQLPEDERTDVASMIGEIFPVDDIDEWGQAWVGKGWPDEAAGTWRGHTVALEAAEFEWVASS
jgi:ureidoglycolate lyase